MAIITDTKSCKRCKTLFASKSENERFCKECDKVRIDGDKEIFELGKSLFTQFDEVCKSHEEKNKNTTDTIALEKLEKIKKELVVQMSIAILNADADELIKQFRSLVFIAEHSLMFQNPEVFNELIKTGIILNEISTTLLASKKLNLRTHVGINNKLTIEKEAKEI